MDPKFYQRVIRELTQLLEDERNGVEPRNRDFRDAVYRELRSQEAGYISLRVPENI